MGKNILLWLAMLLPLTGVAAPASLSIEDFDIKAGEEKEMVIDLTNPQDEITLVQFDLRLPEGLSLKAENGDYVIDMTGRTTWRKHSLDVNAQTNGTIRFLLASNSNTVVTGTEGAIITMTLVADANFNGGEIRLEEILMVSPSEQETKQENYIYWIGPVPVPDRAWLSVDGPFFVLAGAERQLTINLTNPEDEITLVQFDLRLPEGLSLKYDNEDYVYDIAGRTTWKKHSLDMYAQTDGTIRFLLASNSNAVLYDAEGAIIEMTIVADNSFVEGSSIHLENILLVSPDETEVKPADVEYKVVRPKGDVNGDCTIDVADIATVISVMAGQGRNELTKKAADVNSDGRVDVADIATIISIMAGK